MPRLLVGACVATGVTCAAGVYLAARFSGAYFPTAWPLLGAPVVLAAAALLAAGFRPTRGAALAAAALAGLGGWTLLSTAWGGIPDVAWTRFDQLTIAAGALVLGSTLAATAAGSWATGGVVAGLAFEAIELLVRIQVRPLSADWLHGRKVQGPLGYANAQGSLAAAGAILAVGMMSSSRRSVRAPAGAAAGTLCGALLLTQSRGALLALGAGLLAVTLLTREVRTAVLSAAVAAVTALLWLPLRGVDDAIVVGGSNADVGAFHRFGLAVLAGAVVLAALAATRPHGRVVRRTVVAAAVAAAVLAGTLSLARAGAFSALRASFAADSGIGNTSNEPGGDTRLTSLSLTGRVQLWRAAGALFEHHPAVGAGSGQYARTWDRVRPVDNLTVLQPHSIELETLSETGVPGGLLFVAFVLAVLWALRRRGRPSPVAIAAAAGAFVALVVQASLDWTFSFPALVVAVLLPVGVAAGAGRRRATGLAGFTALAAVTLAALVGLAGPFFAARSAAAAVAVLPTDVGRAWDIASRARFYDRWSPAVVAVQARIAAADGDLVQAGALYTRAAQLDQRPWQYDAQAAQAFARAGRGAARRAACRRALRENPLEHSVRDVICRDVSP